MVCVVLVCLRFSVFKGVIRLGIRLRSWVGGLRVKCASADSCSDFGVKCASCKLNEALSFKSSFVKFE